MIYPHASAHLSFWSLILLSMFSDKWVFVSSSDCDLTDLQSTRDCFRQHRPTHVIHLAVLLMDGAAMRTHKVELWETNMAMNQNILKICREFNVQKLVSCLSSFAYPAVLCEVGALLMFCVRVFF